MTLIDIYQKDKEVYKVAIAMQMNGFLFDVEEAQKRRAKLVELEAGARARVEEALGRPIKSTKTGGISTFDLHQAVFKEIRAPMLFKSMRTGKPSLDINAMRGYAASHRPKVRAFALAELERRRAQKLRSTYIDKTLASLDERRRAFIAWRSTGTISGRWSSKLQQLPRAANDPTIVWGKDESGEDVIVGGGIRSLYIAPPGYKIVSFDASQGEMRVAAYISGDPVMIGACESSDLHSANAEIVWGDAFRLGSKRAKKDFRQLAKNFGFAICYLAEAGTVYANIIANGKDANLREIEVAIRKLRGKFAVYFRWQEKRLLEIMKSGYAYSPIIGRRRYLSHSPRPTEAANYHVQSGLADVINEKLVAISDRLCYGDIDAKLVAMVHDSITAEIKDEDVETYQKEVNEIIAQPIYFPSSGVSAVFPVDWHVGQTWA